MLGEGRRGRNHEEGEEPVHLLGCLTHQVSIRSHDLGGAVHLPQHRPGRHGAHRMEAEVEGGHHAEVAATAPQGPEQVRMVLLVGVHERPIGEDQVGAEQAVDGEAETTGEVPDAAAQGEAAHPGGGDEAHGQGEPEGVGGVVDVAEHAAAGDPCRRRGGVDGDAPHR
jgi:hypothetical protein